MQQFRKYYILKNIVYLGGEYQPEYNIIIKNKNRETDRIVKDFLFLIYF